jgi:hypothetical protein
MRFIAITVLLFSAGVVASQTPVIDSLRQQLIELETANDSFQVLHALCEQFNEVYIKTDSLKKYGAATLRIARCQSDDWKIGIGLIYHGAGHFRSDTSVYFESLRDGIALLIRQDDPVNAAIGYHLMGFQLMYYGEFSKMQEFGRAGLALLDQKWDQKNKRIAGLYATLHSLIASARNKSGQLLEAVESSHEAYKYATIAEDHRSMYEALLNLSATYGDMSDAEKGYGTLEDRAKYKPIARQYMLDAYNLAKKNNFEKSASVSAFNLSVSYSIDQDYVKSDSFLNEAIAVGIKTRFTLLLYNCYILKAQNFQEQMIYDSSAPYLDYAMQYAQAMASPNLILRTRIEIATAAFQRGDIDQADRLCADILPLIQGADDRLLRKKVYTLLADIKESRGQWKSALQYFKLKEAVIDSIMDSESYDQIANLRSRYESELQSFEIDKLNQQKHIDQLKIKRKNNTIIFLVLATLLFTGLIYYYFRSLAIKEKHLAIHAQQKLLRTQLNPHFLFNSLNSIQQFIYAKKDPNMIADYLGKFSRLTRRILQYSQEDYVSLADEIDFLKDYLDLQKIRFDEPFHYDIIFADDMDLEDIMIPPLFTQPFVENSIEHGILNKQEKGRIQVRFSKNDTHLMVTMTDNGVGRELAAFRKRNQKHRSLATKITRERLRVIEKKLRKKASLVIQDLTDKDLVVGTKVIVTLPLIYS